MPHRWVMTPTGFPCDRPILSRIDRTNQKLPSKFLITFRQEEVGWGRGKGDPPGPSHHPPRPPILFLFAEEGRVFDEVFFYFFFAFMGVN